MMEGETSASAPETGRPGPGPGSQGPGSGTMDVPAGSSLPAAAGGAAAAAGATATALARDPRRLGRAGKILWILVAILSGAYVVFPDPTDALIPMMGLGLVDDGVFFGVFLYALERLGIHIPILSKLFGLFRRNRGGAGS